MLNRVCKTQPYKHQLIALSEGHKQKNFAYFMEMGTGKTKVAIDNANYLYEQGEINDVIVIAPNSVYTNWVKEIKNHSKVQPQIFIWKTHDPEKLAVWNYDSFFFLLMNVEALSRDKGIKFLKKQLIKRGNHTMLIVDESTTIKNKTAQRTKSLCKVGLSAKYKRILTGSPVTKSPLDLYTQCQFLDKDLLGFSSFYTFRNRYAILQEINLGTHSTKIPVKYINTEELEQKLKGFSYRCTKADCLDLPPKLHTKRLIEMTDEQTKVYQKLKKEARAIIYDEEVSYTNKLTEILKLHQVACGFSKTDTGEIVSFKKNPKLIELANILEETSGKSIIWANYVHNIEQIKTMLEKTYGKESVVSIYGAISVENRKVAVDRFQDDDGCRFLVGNPSVGGYGLTLTSSRNVIFFSNSYNLEHRDQSEDRAHRIGQTAKVTYIDLVVPKTIDELVLNSLNKKRDLSKEIMGDHVKKYFD
jgi:SNF2 family DNA or RNA helicase